MQQRGSQRVHRDRLGRPDTRGVRAGSGRQARDRLRDRPHRRRVRPAHRPPWPPRHPRRADGGHRTARRAAGRPPAGGRPPRRGGQPQRDQGLARRQVVSGAKSDTADAHVIACYLRLCHHRLRVLAPFSAQTRALRAVVRTRTDLVDQRVAATNQLAACLDAFWPGAKAVFADLESEIALAFLTRYPTPESATHLGEARMRAFCVKHGYCGRRSAAELMARLRAAPQGLAGGPESEARRDATLAMVAVLRALNTAIKDLDRSVVAHLGEHPDEPIFTSLPRSGQINAAQVLAEWGDCRQAYDAPDAVAALAGAAPVTKQSGKHHAVHFRW